LIIQMLTTPIHIRNSVALLMAILAVGALVEGGMILLTIAMVVVMEEVTVAEILAVVEEDVAVAETKNNLM
jgi:hypothetical protein